MNTVSCTFKNGTNYTGEYYKTEDNLMFHGKGRMVCKNGDMYWGEWKNGERHGKGTYIWQDGEKYQGEFKDGKYHGQGTYTWPNEPKYVGQWRKGKFHGRGTITFTKDSEYKGKFKNGKMHGKGAYTWEGGRKKYIGKFKDGGICDKGIYIDLSKKLDREREIMEELERHIEIDLRKIRMEFFNEKDDESYLDFTYVNRPSND